MGTVPAIGSPNSDKLSWSPTCVSLALPNLRVMESASQLSQERPGRTQGRRLIKALCVPPAVTIANDDISGLFLNIFPYLGHMVHSEKNILHIFQKIEVTSSFPS